MKAFPRITLVTLALAGLACSDGKSGNANDVTGTWCGLEAATTAAACVGDRAIYLDLAQTGTVVTGTVCQAYDHDCTAIANGDLAGRMLFLDYPAPDATITAQFLLADDGERMQGAFTEIADSGDVSVLFTVSVHRLD